MTDSMINHHIINLEQEFITQGGIKERMYAARTGYRQQQEKELAELRNRVKEQEKEISLLKKIVQKYQNNSGK